MKGIILSGGIGTRLYPITIGFSKQLIPIYDKPMIYYPLTTLINLGIKEILIIAMPNQLENFKKILGNGSRFGISLSYKVQKKPEGIAQAFIIGKEFIKKDSVALILGDNIFHGHIFNENLDHFKGSKIFLYKVSDPFRYGVATIKNNKIKSIIEKPKKTISNLAVTGLYFYDNNIIKIAKTIKPSKRNELEITDVNNHYLKNDNLNYTLLSKESIWFDAGTSDSLLEASNYIQAILKRQNIQIGCPEEAAFKKNFINKRNLINIISKMPFNKYSAYLKELLKNKI
tara:strand:+ start:896 stop:1753 length:858 start_codon:yes stop_codon:yes gene_type:complete